MAKKNVRDEPLKPQVSENEQMSDIVFILDKMELILQAVSKIGKDGKYSTVPADKEHSNSFLKIDRYANMFENFVKNFWSQLKDPTRFGILSVKADTLDSPEVKQAIEDLAAGKQTKAVEDFLKKYEIVPRDKENQSINNQNQEEMAKKNETQQQATQGDGTQQPKYRYNESMINWEELKNFGLSREYLMERGLLDQMLRGYKTNQVVPISMNFGSAVLRTDARLSFQQSVGGPIVLGIHGIRQKPELERPYFGHIFSEEDKKNLLETGNMGRVVELVDKETGEIIPSYISIDRQTNEIEAIPVKDVPVTTRIGQTEFTEHEIAELVAGRALPNKEIVLSEKRKFTATLQVNVERRGVEFVPKPKQNGQNRRQRNGQVTGQTAQQPARPVPTAQAAGGQTATGTEGEQKPKVYKFQWLDENGNIRAPKTMGGIPLTQQQQQNFTAGNAILVKDMKRDGKGEPFTAYVKFSFEAGKPKYYRNNPDVAQEITPASESRTQVAVNTHGNTNEATRHLNQPLRQGQTAPANTQQQRTQNRAAGVRM